MTAAVGSTQAVLQSTIAATLAKVTAAGAAARAGVSAWQGSATTRVAQIYQQGSQSIQQSAQQTSQKGQQAAQQAAQQAESQITQAAQRGKALGDSRAGAGSSIPEAAQKKADAAHELGDDAYQKISDAAAPTAQKLSSAGPDFTAGIQQSVQQVIGGLLQALPQALAQVQQLGQQTSQGIGQMLTMTTQGLSQMGASLRAQLAQAQGRARTSITTAAAEQRAAIAQAGQQVRSSLVQERTATLHAADQNIEQAKQEVAGKPIPAGSSAQILARVIPMVRRGLQPMVAAARQSIGRVTTGLRRAGASGAAALTRLSADSASGIRKLGATAQQAATRQAQQATQQLGKLSKQTTTAGNQMLQHLQQSVAKTVQAVQSSLGQQLGQFMGGLRQAAASAVGKASEPLQDLASRITSAQAKIETKYQQEKEKNDHKSLLEKAWDTVTGWITAALNWLKDNWKMIVMIIAIVVVTVALGAAALVLAPMLAGLMGGGLLATIVAGAVVGVGAGVVGRIAGQVITNVATGKSPFAIEWGKVFDPKALLMDALTGGIGAGVGQALKGASMIKQVLVNAGVGLGSGMLGNVIHGESPFHDVKSLIIATIGGALGPVMGSKMDGLSTATKSALNATVAFGTGMINNVVHGRGALDNPGDLVASSVSAAVNTAGMEKVGNNHPNKSPEVAAHQTPTEHRPNTAPPRETPAPAPVPHETAAPPARPHEPTAREPTAHEPTAHEPTPAPSERPQPAAHEEPPPPRDTAHTEPGKREGDGAVHSAGEQPTHQPSAQPAHPGVEHAPGVTSADAHQQTTARGVEEPQTPLGARGPKSGRPFDPEKSGGPIRELSTDKVRITERGIDVVESHLSRFGADAPNQAMVERLRQIAAGKLEPTQADLNFYTHELREFVRYRKLGYKEGQPANSDEAYELWNNAHTATLEDYGLKEGPGVLYHPEAEAATGSHDTGTGPAGGRNRSSEKTENTANSGQSKQTGAEQNPAKSPGESVQERIDRVTFVNKGEAHEQQMAALRQKLQRQDAYISEYLEKHPNTTLTTDQLARRADSGAQLNNETGRARYGEANQPADFRHKYKGEAENYQPQMKEYEAAYAKLLGERDQAIKQRDAHPKGSDEYKSFQQQVVDASSQLGELSAKEYVHSTQPDAKLLSGLEGSRRDVFDQIYSYVEGGIEKFIVVEAKGGKSPLDTRRVGAQGKRAEQGSREYFDEIVKLMSSSKDPKIRAAGRKLSMVESPEEMVKYLHIESPIGQSDGKSTVKNVAVREFDLGADGGPNGGP